MDYSKWDHLDDASSEEEGPCKVTFYDNGERPKFYDEKPKPAQKRLEPPPEWPIVEGKIRRHPEDTFAYPSFSSNEDKKPWGLPITNGLRQTVGQYRRHQSPLEQYVDRKVRDLPGAGDSRLVVKCSLGKKIWRRSSFRSKIKLHSFQDKILVPLCGTRRGARGHVIIGGGCVFGPSLEDYEDMRFAPQKFLHVASDANVAIGSLLRRVGDVVDYHYDLEAGWRWRIELERFDTAFDSDIGRHPDKVELLGGEGADPPECVFKSAQRYLEFIESHLDGDDASAVIETVEKGAPNYVEDYVTRQPRRFRPLSFDHEFHEDKIDAFCHSCRLMRHSEPSHFGEG